MVLQVRETRCAMSGILTESSCAFRRQKKHRQICPNEVACNCQHKSWVWKTSLRYHRKKQINEVTVNLVERISRSKKVKQKRQEDQQLCAICKDCLQKIPQGRASNVCWCPQIHMAKELLAFCFYCSGSVKYLGVSSDPKPNQPTQPNRRGCLSCVTTKKYSPSFTSPHTTYHTSPHSTCFLPFDLSTLPSAIVERRAGSLDLPVITDSSGGRPGSRRHTRANAVAAKCGGNAT